MSDSPGTNLLSKDEPGRRSAELLSELYEELRRLATTRMAKEASGHTLQATALVHEAWLRLVEKGDRTWQSRGHFFAAAAESMRRILVESARRKARLRHGGGQVRMEADLLDGMTLAEREDQVLLIEEGLKELERANAERAQVVVLKFFGGLTNLEVAESLGSSERSVDRHWACAKVWLLHWVERRP